MGSAARFSSTTMHHDNGYGHERYRYTPEQPIRHRTEFARTLRPNVAETNGDFEARMDELARVLVLQHHATSVDVLMQRSDGSVVECLVTVCYPPRPEPVAIDRRLAGGRPAPRGSRGGK